MDFSDNKNLLFFICYLLLYYIRRNWIHLFQKLWHYGDRSLSYKHHTHNIQVFSYKSFIQDQIKEAIACISFDEGPIDLHVLNTTRSASTKCSCVEIRWRTEVPVECTWKKPTEFSTKWKRSKNTRCKRELGKKR